jgi:threonine dehydrogenase-like Zn-dependent dehydrogenase
MQAIYVDKNLPRMLLVKALRPVWPGVIWSAISPARATDRMAVPDLPGDHWVRVRNRQCGICASDLALLNVNAGPDIAPAALPGNSRFYLGHEVVGEVIEVGKAVTRFKPGDRVVMESRFAGPNCHTQEIEPPCSHCAEGQTRLCENASLGSGPSGVGGGWGDQFTAHESEIWPVPDELSDDQAMLIEPMTVAVHAVLRRVPQSGDNVLIIGAGIIGLLTLQAIRALSPECKVTILARHDHQIAAAERLGADQVLAGGDLYTELAGITEAKHYQFPMNRGMLLGGFEVIYDCVGSATTVVDSLRWARAGGAVVLVGITFGMLKTDLNPVWYQEVDLIGSYVAGMEFWQGRQVHTYDLVIEMLKNRQLTQEGLITHRFPFKDYRKAIATAQDKKTGSIKVAFVYDQ